MTLLSTIAPFEEAMRELSARGVLPTNLSSRELQKLGAQFHAENFTSAHTLLTDLLDGYKAKVGKIINPVRVTRDTGQVVTEGLNVAKAREQTKFLLQELGYNPQPDQAGTIQDLSSDARINLVINTNVQTSQGLGWWLQSQDTAVLDEFPAQELFRAEDRAKARDWLARFRLAGEATGDPIGTGWIITKDGRMIALKNHPIWTKLGDSSLFSDALGNPYPPFAFNSGMDVRDVDRAETESLGLIQPGETVDPMTLDDLAAETAAVPGRTP